MEKIKSRAIQLVNEEGYNFSESARILAKEFNIENVDTLRKNVSNWNNRNAFIEECEKQGINPDEVPRYWYKGKHFSINVNPGQTNIEDAVRRIISQAKLTPQPITKVVSSSEMALRVVLSDMHVGLNPGAKSLYSYEYNADIFNQRIDHVYNYIRSKVMQNGPYDVLFIDDLGDGLDGYNGKTTRGGHELEQNMTTEQQFETFVQGKLRLIRMCESFAKKIICRNVTSDNHSGSFAYIANRTIQMVLEHIMPKVEFMVLDEFITPTYYGDHCHILTHGKDAKYMFKGFPLKLDPKTSTILLDYIYEKNITSKYIHLDKGDLHQLAYDRARRFDYRNFMSFAPPSNWVQHNFGVSYCGYSVQEIPKFSNDVRHTDIFFD
jgi:hypothetical protein